MSPADGARAPLLSVHGLEKSFGATKVLRGVNFTVRTGEIHALLGGNGAGKSTLIRIVTGNLRRDGGEVASTSLRNPGTSPVVAVVHQELALLPHLSVAENIGLVHERRGWGIHRSNRQATIAKAALDLIDPGLAERALHAPAARLSLHEAQIVEIARALSIGAEILLLDEPTANLTAQETELLFSVLRRLVREQGLGIVFVSHRMKEIRKLCDRCTIIRDGRSVVDSRAVADLTDSEIVAEMGQPGQDVVRRTRFLSREADLVLQGPDGARISCAAGTVIGLAGSPTGPSALIDTLVGHAPKPIWTMQARNHPETFASPAEAVRNGVGYISGDRRGKGILADLPILDNVLAARRVRDRRWLVGRRDDAECLDLVQALKLKAGSIHDLPRSLSGGNQQKLLVARWLGLSLRIVVFEEPTRGVDIGTKRDIYGLIRDMAAAGAIILWWSTENAELLELCDRIFAFDTEGRPVGELAEDRFTEDGIAELTGMAA
jgi:ribose transport system ATP-binding protein